MVKRIQGYRKELGLQITDRIIVSLQPVEALREAAAMFGDYIAEQVLADAVQLTDEMPAEAQEFDFDGFKARIAVQKA